jgi:hypothetical protein
MNKTLVIAIAVSLLAGCGKKKAGNSNGSASTTGSGGAGSEAGGAGLASGGAGSGGAFWTDKPDPLQQAVLDATAANLLGAGKKDPSLVGKIIDATAAAHASVSRDAWDPAAVITIVGKDRAALFKWVRDNTALVPYRGSLRGPVGVMMDRVGNSLDRALLLADVLGRTGLEVRLANAQLPPDLVAKLAASAKTRTRPALSTAHIDDAALIATLAKITGADAASLTAAADKQQAAFDAIIARTKTRVDAQTKALAALVPPAGAAASSDDAYTDHWWVQVHDGEAWSDLDPSLPTASPGEALASTATDTLDPKDLADDRRHTLAIRVIGEIWHGDTREETVLAEHAFAPSLFFGQRIMVTNAPLDMPAEKEFYAAPDPLAFTQKALIAQHEVAPVIIIGTTPVAHFSVNDRGELLDLTSGDANTIGLARTVEHATKDGVGGATGLLDQLPDETTAGSGGSAPAAPAAAPPAFTAEWLEIEIRTPGSAPKVVRRTVFDTLGPVADRNAARPHTLSDAARLDRMYALTSETELLPMFAQIPSAFVADRTVQALVAARAVLIAGVTQKKLDEAQQGKLATLASAPGSVYGLALARFVDPSIYLDELDVFAVRRRIVARDKSFAVRNESDIFANAVAVWPSNPDPRMARIAQGVRDTDLEFLVAPCFGHAPCLRAPSTAELFAASSKDWSVNATPAGDAANDQAAGYAVVDRGASRQTWWRINPSTGETLGMTPMGGSVITETATTETLIKLKASDNLIPALVNFTYCLFNHRNDPGSTGGILASCGLGAALGGALGTAGGVFSTGASVAAQRGIVVATTLLGNMIQTALM